MPSQDSTDVAITHYEQAVRLIDPSYRLLSVRRLEGGVSAQVAALDVVKADGTRRTLLMRRHGEADRRRNPRIAADEFRLLHSLHAKGLRTQTPVFLDESCRIFATPYLVVEYIDGKTDIAPAKQPSAIRQMAAQLVAIHRISGADATVGFLPVEVSGFGRRPAVLDDSIGEGRIRDTLEALWPLAAANETVLLHGDYWPGNILWKAGKLVGVVDWENARLGDPLCDLANSRLEILWAYGEAAMQRFTRCYRSLSRVDFINLPYWDLCAALRPAHKLSMWVNDKASEARMREQHALFVTWALQAIGE